LWQMKSRLEQKIQKRCLKFLRCDVRLCDAINRIAHISKKYSFKYLHNSTKQTIPIESNVRVNNSKKRTEFDLFLACLFFLPTLIQLRSSSSLFHYYCNFYEINYVVNFSWFVRCVLFCAYWSEKFWFMCFFVGLDHRYLWSVFKFE
jgi:hypothetical protein